MRNVLLTAIAVSIPLARAHVGKIPLPSFQLLVLIPSSSLHPRNVGISRHQNWRLPLRQQGGDSAPAIHFRAVVVRECRSSRHIPSVADTNRHVHQHGHLGDPPPANTFFDLPAGRPAMAQLGCNMGLTDYWKDSPGRTDIRTEDDSPCPSKDNSTAAYHVSLFRILSVLMADFPFPGVTEYVMRYFLLLSRLTLTFR